MNSPLSTYLCEFNLALPCEDLALCVNKCCLEIRVRRLQLEDLREAASRARMQAISCKERFFFFIFPKSKQ